MQHIDLFECSIPVITTGYKYAAIITSTFILSLSMLATFGNLIVILSIAKNRRIQTQSNVLLGSLCLTDLMVGAIGQPVFVARRILEVTENADSSYCTLQKIHIFFAYFGVGASITTMAIVSLDRWFAICRPFLYQQFQSKHRCLIAIVVDWVLLMVLMSLPYIGLASVAIYIGASIIMIISIITIIACYINIYRVILRHKRRISEQTVSQVEASDQRNDRQAERRKTNTVAILIVILFLCYTPHVAVICYKSFSGRKVEVASKIAETIILMNSSINPIVYCLRSTEILLAVKEMLRKILCKDRTADHRQDSFKHEAGSKKISCQISSKP